MEHDGKALVKIIVSCEYEGLKGINAGLGVQGLYMGSSTGPVAHGDLKNIFMVMSFLLSVWQADVGVLE